MITLILNSVLNDSEDPNFISPLKPINRWNDSNSDGEILKKRITTISNQHQG